MAAAFLSLQKHVKADLKASTLLSYPQIPPERYLKYFWAQALLAPSWGMEAVACISWEAEHPLKSTVSLCLPCQGKAYTLLSRHDCFVIKVQTQIIFMDIFF